MPVRRGKKGHDLERTEKKVHVRNPQTNQRELCTIYQCTNCGAEGTRRNLLRGSADSCSANPRKVRGNTAVDQFRAAGAL